MNASKVVKVSEWNVSEWKVGVEESCNSSPRTDYKEQARKSHIVSISKAYPAIALITTDSATVGPRCITVGKYSNIVCFDSHAVPEYGTIPNSVGPRP